VCTDGSVQGGRESTVCPLLGPLDLENEGTADFKNIRTYPNKVIILSHDTSIFCSILVWWSQNPYQAFEYGTGLPKSKFSLWNFMLQKSTAFFFCASEAGSGNIYVWFIS